MFSAVTGSIDQTSTIDNKASIVDSKHKNIWAFYNSYHFIGLSHNHKSFKCLFYNYPSNPEARLYFRVDYS